MPKGLKNWTYDNVIKFLKAHDFFSYRPKGGSSHTLWLKVDNSAIVEVNKTKKTYPPRTLETMIQQSGIEKDHWKGWADLGCPKKNRCCEKEVE